MYIIRKTYKIEYAHQLKSAFTSCCHETIHGHSGVIEVFFKSDSLNKDGMVIDFGEISNLIKEEIMELDHSLIMPYGIDEEYHKILKKYNKKLIMTDFNPTAESLAKFLCCNINNNILAPKKLMLISSIRFHETETGYAEFIWDNK